MQTTGTNYLSCGAVILYHLFHYRNDLNSVFGPSDNTENLKARATITDTTLSDGLRSLLTNYGVPQTVILLQKQVVFSDVTLDGNSPGDKLAALIESKGWGAIMAGPVSVNPNSGNPIRVWVWTPNLKMVEDLNPFSINMMQEIRDIYAKLVVKGRIPQATQTVQSEVKRTGTEG